jgi:hypothetical protein
MQDIRTAPGAIFIGCTPLMGVFILSIAANLADFEHLENDSERSQNEQTWFAL